MVGLPQVYCKVTRHWCLPIYGPLHSFDSYNFCYPRAFTDCFSGFTVRSTLNKNASKRGTWGRSYTDMPYPKLKPEPHCQTVWNNMVLYINLFSTQHIYFNLM